MTLKFGSVEERYMLRARSFSPGSSFECWPRNWTIPPKNHYKTTTIERKESSRLVWPKLDVIAWRPEFGLMSVPVSKVETLYSYIKVSTGFLCVQAFRKCLDNSVLRIPITPFYTSFKMASDKAFQHSTAFHVCEWYLQSCGRKDTMFFLWDNQPPHYKWYSSERSGISSVLFLTSYFTNF